MAGPNVQREGNNEARLRKDRLASSRAAGNEGPSPGGGLAADSGMLNVPFLGNKALELANRSVIDLHGAQVPAGTIDQTARDSGRIAALRQAMRMGRNPRGGDAEAASREGGGGLSPRQAMSLAKASPVGMAATVAFGGMTGQGLPTAEVQRIFGRGCVRSLWASLWPTFGHSIYFIGIIFFVAGNSKFVRKYVPRVGEEWFPPDILKKIPKSALIPLKMAETMGIAFILFWVLLLDLTCLGIWALMLGFILSAVS